MIFLDSSFLIAFFLRNNTNYDRASAIFESINGETFLITHHVISEVVTMIGRKIDSKAAVEVYNFLIYSCKVSKESSKDYNKAIELFSNYDGELSFVDCLSIAIMKSKNVSKIISFDDVFDKVLDIERIS